MGFITSLLALTSNALDVFSTEFSRERSNCTVTGRLDGFYLRISRYNMSEKTARWDLVSV